MIVWGISQDREGSWDVDVRSKRLFGAYSETGRAAGMLINVKSINDGLGHIPRQGGRLGC